MSQKPIREVEGKLMLFNFFSEQPNRTQLSNKFVAVTKNTDYNELIANPKYAWLKSDPLVAKPDQLIKRRGKAGLIKLKASFDEAKNWIQERMGKEVQVETVRGELNQFIIESFVPHDQKDEYYICIQSVREGDLVYFYHEGGVDIGDVDSKAEQYLFPTDEKVSEQDIKKHLLSKVPAARQNLLAKFIGELYQFYSEYHYAYLEINPLVVKDDNIYALDLAAKVDQTADFEVGEKWGRLSFPPPFGRAQTPEEQFIASLDAKTGASLKLTILNPEGRIWTMVAGGGASVVYADTISDLGFGKELANYGEYSGDPSEGLTYEYAKTILDLMTRKLDSRGKILIIGGGIANFTNVALTFKGIIRALTQYSERLKENQVKVYVRRGGPNYQQGLREMQECGENIGVPIEVYGPETHLTSIVTFALKGDSSQAKRQKIRGNSVDLDESSSQSPNVAFDNNSIFSSGHIRKSSSQTSLSGSQQDLVAMELSEATPQTQLFNKHTFAVVYGMQPSAVQNMLDFDHVCRRTKPSVVAMIYPFSGNHFQKFYWGSQEILIPVYEKMDEALKKHPEITVLVNFASFRSVYSSVEEALDHPQIRTIAIIAEGVPERRTKSLIKRAHKCGVTIIGPATVGGIKPGCFRIGNSGGMIDNIISSKLWRPGSVAYISRSGGMSNELNNIISRNTNGVYEGIAIGGDRFPGTTFIDHILRFQEDPHIKVLVLLGEVGGIDEYAICEAVKSGKITKPIVGWCMGTCAKIFPYEVQFGHAGALARGNMETAEAKNKAMRDAGIFVPSSFDEFDTLIKSVYEKLKSEGIIQEQPEPMTPTVPMDYSWAQKLGLIRKPANFVTSISDERGDELLYSGVPISSVFSEDLGVGGVISLLWFKRRLPSWASKFLEMVLMLVADHGPAVSGAHNTIVTARAGKDLISSLVSGLVTIGPRFGGAIDGAAQQFSEAYDAGISAKIFVDKMKKENKLIMGVGHRVKSISNPDKRVSILKEYVTTHFPKTDLLNFALEVEKVTTAKKENLILNVDGCIGVSFVDLLRGCGMFTREEADSYIGVGLNGIFVLGRSIGLIGHYLDQVRLKQPLYRHPWDDISYVDE